MHMPSELHAANAACMYAAKACCTAKVVCTIGDACHMAENNIRKLKFK